jgi:membrane-bound inhibitor of C-type lysozyme
MDYACADGSRIGVGYPSDDIIRVRTSAGRNLVLTRTETASGVRFTDGQHNIWNKGDDIMWSEGSTQDALLCRKG